MAPNTSDHFQSKHKQHVFTGITVLVQTLFQPQCILLSFLNSLISSPPVCLPGGEVLVGRRVPTEDHPRYCEDVFIHRQSHENTTAAAGT